MNKKTECEIVQDLLLGYVDDVLNLESKKLVEKHLVECKECQTKLNEIRTDIKNNEKNQKMQIDYLKKIRRKNNIKSILIAIGIILLIFLIVYLRKFIIINNIMNKANKSLASENFYIETTQRLSSSEVALTKEWYKDGKYKTITEIYSDKGVETMPAEYATINTDERTEIDHKNKQVTISKGEFTEIINKEKSIKDPQFGLNSDLIFKLGKAFYSSISTSTRDLGREYYVLTNAFNKDSSYVQWVDMDTGLPLKISGNGTSKLFYPGTNVVKEEAELCYEYRYEFDTVTDEDVTVPAYSNYEIQYRNTNIAK